jgi:hypothetical protein
MNLVAERVGRGRGGPSRNLAPVYTFNVFGRELTVKELEWLFGVRACNFRHRIRWLPPEAAALPISRYAYWKMVKYGRLQRRTVSSGPQMAGRVYGEMTIVRRFKRASKRRRWYLCRCLAGHEYPIFVDGLRNNLRCAKCLPYGVRRTMELHQPGSVFGPWTVLRVLPGKHRSRIVCRCSCGSERAKTPDELRVAQLKPCNRCVKRGLAKRYDIFVVKMTATDASNIFGVGLGLFLRRVQRGLSPELAVTLPVGPFMSQRLRFSGVLKSVS